MLLAIESAVDGGSIAILDGESVVGSLVGSDGVSKAEDILPKLDLLLDQIGCHKDQITKIAVSVGPGSFTGLRIGISSALGLRSALGIECIGVNLFSAIQQLDAAAAIAIPLGRTDICFRSSMRSPITAFPKPDLANQFAGVETVLCHATLLGDLEAEGVRKIVSIGNDLAVLVGKYAIDLPSSTNFEPIYVQSPRFI